VTNCGVDTDSASLEGASLGPAAERDLISRRIHISQ